MVRAHVPVTKVRGFEARRALDIHGPPDGYGCGWWQAAARRSRVGDRPCAAMCVRQTFDSKLSALEQELRDRRVEDRANATSSA